MTTNKEKKLAAVPAAPAAVPTAKNAVSVEGKPGQTEDRVIAEVSLSPTNSSALTAATFSQYTFGQLSLQDVLQVMCDKAAKVNTGDLKEAESMLAAQATALDAIFNEMARRAAMNMGQHLGATDTYLRLALKAQSQCRSTVEALAEIKNPRPVAFVKQANIANGPQQVNNGVAGPAPARVEEKVIPQNELSGAGNGLLPNTGASQTEGQVNSTLEAVGGIDGPKVARGEGDGIAERIQGRSVAPIAGVAQDPSGATKYVE